MTRRRPRRRNSFSAQSFFLCASNRLNRSVDPNPAFNAASFGVAPLSLTLAAYRLRTRALATAPAIELVEIAKGNDFDVADTALNAIIHFRRRDDDDSSIGVSVLTRQLLMIVRASVSHTNTLGLRERVHCSTAEIRNC